MKKSKLGFVGAALASSVLFASGQALAASSNSNANAQNNITICHATGSSTNPYVKLTANANGVVNGHANHQNDQDIIPPFTYNDGSTTNSFAGLNWDANGQATFNNNCVATSMVGGMGGGGGAPVAAVLGATTGVGGAGGGNGESASSTAPQTQTPAGSVNAGEGPAPATLNTKAAAGLGSSLVALASGTIWLGKRKALRV